MRNNKYSQIHLSTDLQSFFCEELRSTAEKQGLGASDQVVHYLAAILEKFSKSQSYFLKIQQNNNNNAAPSTDTPMQNFPNLAMMWMESLTSAPQDQYFLLQQLGDVALFTSGFFGERIARSLVDMDYYMAMGGMAYEKVGLIRESIQAEKAMNVYFELAEKFSRYVEVFAELSDQSLLGNNRDILKLYERWLRTGSFRISRMLSEAGIIADKGPPKSGGIS